MAQLSDERYQNGRIYKIVNNVDDEIYVGSTCLPLSKRLYYHKCDRNKKSLPCYQHLNKIGWENVSIILVENYPCNSKEELLARERYHYDILKPSLNGYRPFVTREEHLTNRKEYYVQNKDAICESKKEYYEKNKYAICESKKEYYMQNKEKRAEYNKQYAQESYHCDSCNCDLTLCNKSKHEKTKKHLANVSK